MGNDPAGDFETRNIALARGRRINTVALQAIWTIDARRNDFNQDLAGPRFRHRRLAYPDDVRAAMAFEMNLPHHLHGISALRVHNKRKRTRVTPVSRRNIW
jgi:hypothetical protein